METRNCIHTISTPSLPPTVRMPFWGERVLKILLRWSARGRQRRDLAYLDDAALKDIGLTRMDVEREITKPFWQA